MTFSDLIKKLQTAMNEQGASLVVDGDPGPKTQTALDRFDAFIVLENAEPEVVKPTQPAQGDFGAPWVFSNIDLLGKNERDPDLNARYVPEWKHMARAKNYNTLSGNDYAWCAVKVSADLRKHGIVGTDDPGAASYSEYGKDCPFWFGCILPIRHHSGGRHVCFFLYWIDEKRKIAATIDGNRSNMFGIFETNLSGSSDSLVPGPRWPKNWTDGQIVPMNEVLTKYPFLKVGGKGSGTT